MAIAVKDVRAVLEIAQHRRSMGHISTQQYYFRKKMGQQGLELAFLTKKSCFLASSELSDKLQCIILIDDSRLLDEFNK